MYYHVIDETNGPIYFAGEHTARPHGWINTAIFSGVRAAKRLLDDFCGQEEEGQEGQGQEEGSGGRYGGYRSGNFTKPEFKPRHWKL